jgi:hypothetical protein
VSNQQKVEISKLKANINHVSKPKKNQESCKDKPSLALNLIEDLRQLHPQSFHDLSKKRYISQQNRTKNQ